MWWLFVLNRHMLVLPRQERSHRSRLLREEQIQKKTCMALSIQKTPLLWSKVKMPYTIPSAEALGVLCVRRKWRHDCGAKIGDEIHQTFRCQEFALFGLPLSTCGAEIDTASSHFQLQKNLCSSFCISLARREIEQPKKIDRMHMYGCTILLHIEKRNQINAKSYWK